MQTNDYRVSLLPIQPFKQKHENKSFKEKQEKIDNILYSEENISLEKWLELIFENFEDVGLTANFINKLFECKDSEIAYFIPELAYIAIRRSCRHIKKLLIAKASKDESLRRLILWQVRAFSVLIKKADAKVKTEIESLEEAIIKTVPNEHSFKTSEKAIAMLSQASLTLKTYTDCTKEDLKNKLKSFVNKFNTAFLNNKRYPIHIPFRNEKGFDWNSTLLVRIVEDNCSVFPTKLRVPYRIIMETIDIKELEKIVLPELKTNSKIEMKESEFFSKVEEIVQSRLIKENNDSSYPFMIDNERNLKNEELKNFFELKVKEEKNELKFNNVIPRSPAITSNVNLHKSLLNFRVIEDENVKKFDAIYLPVTDENEKESARKSEINRSDAKRSIVRRGITQRYSITKESPKKKFVQEEIYDSYNLECERIWGKPWSTQKRILKETSLYKKLESHKFHNVVVKGGDDLRQEIICMQLIYKMRDILKDANIEAVIKPYEIIVLSENSGTLEFVANSITVHEMREEGEHCSILEFFNKKFQTPEMINLARMNFTKSLAGSAILTYLLSVKDRHNKNILIDIDGNIINIDFGFILNLSPGGFKWEFSPFKFTWDYLEVLGGVNNDYYKLFCTLFCEGMYAIKKRLNELTIILKIMMYESDLECFKNFSLDDFLNLFGSKHTDDVNEFKKFCTGLIETSLGHFFTRSYDAYQQRSNNINP